MGSLLSSCSSRPILSTSLLCKICCRIWDKKNEVRNHFRQEFQDYFSFYTWWREWFFFPDQTILQGFWPYLVHKCPWFFLSPSVLWERQTERGNEGVCLGEKLTIGGQNSPGLPKSLSLLTITICCYSKCASKLVKSLKVFVQLCWLWVKNLPGHYKKNSPHFTT